MKIFAIVAGISIFFNFVENEWIEVPQIDVKRTTQSTRIPDSPSSTSKLDEVLESPPTTTTNSSIQSNENFYLESKIINDKDDFFQNIKTDGFLPVLTNMQKVLVESAQRTVKNKIKFLKNMQNTILETIHEKIANLWNRGQQPESMDARGYHEQEMDFPSNEGALITIGFLTFAVFLIKLVLKLIHGLKNKQIMTMPMPADDGMSAMLRYKREDLQYGPLDILKYIEEYKFTNN